MSYAEAMTRYGSDKPDLRIPLELVTSRTSCSRSTSRSSRPAEDPGRVAALRAPGGARMSRKEIDDYTRYVGQLRRPGLAWVKVNDLAAGVDGAAVADPQVHARSGGHRAHAAPRAADGDIVFFGADRAGVVNESSAPCAQGGAGPGHGRGGLGAPVGGRFPHVRG
jgi:aspartyl-tRNA synthetase